ncbi:MULTISPECIES: YbaB/EbfC family nucleoid-associated protein [Candidatus Ichthyocystis]|uniref:Nucleoid-associated protein Ark11_0592 n=1 Tax=Candidatus Ichthyocystis hellenicum TaxID=1561003 RepID=A0A0S4M0V8_9BURK|nr:MULTISPECIES: YbaB/EbfC family nucleoid-associated protein [Ichthyocystis]CUT17429.1 putative DNA-binding protein, YbaB/EbfC family [Candidatus Ichthyocystis hellenicum]
MKGQLAVLMEQAQQMQENLKNMQDELGSVEVSGEAGEGLVKVVMTCRYTMKSIRIKKRALVDVDVLESLILSAYHDAFKKIEKAVQEKMGALTAGVQLPTDVFKMSL